MIADRPWGTGEGRSKKQAEQRAAREAYLALQAADHADGEAAGGVDGAAGDGDGATGSGVDDGAPQPSAAHRDGEPVG